MTAAERRASFRDLHVASGIFVMPNPWDAGSAKLLAAAGFAALATTSSGLALTLGRPDQSVGRDELVAHTAALAEATDLPLNVDAEACYPHDEGGVARTVRLLSAAGAAGLSIEDYDPVNERVEDLSVATARVAEVVAAAQAEPDPLVITARAEQHLYGSADLDDTIGRLIAYRDAGADVVYAPGLLDLDEIRRVVDAVGVPVNVLALPGCPSVADLGRAGVSRVSTGGVLSRVAYGALVTAAAELRATGTDAYASGALPGAVLAEAFD